MTKTIFLQTFPKFLLANFQKSNSWIITTYTDEDENKTEFYNSYFIYKHYYCSNCGTVEIRKKRAERKDNFYTNHTCKVCKNNDFLNLLSNNEFFKAKGVEFELFENKDFYHIQPYIYIPFVNYENKMDLRAYKCDKNIYQIKYFKEDFFKEENIKYRITDISINEINNFFFENLRDEYFDKKEII